MKVRRRLRVAPPAAAARSTSFGDRLAAEVRAYERRVSQRRTCRAAALLIIAGLMVAGWQVGLLWPAVSLLAPLVVGSVESISAAASLAAAKRLAGTREPSAVGPLVLACRDGDPATRTVAWAGLARLLPTLTPAAASVVTPDIVGSLVALLLDESAPLAGRVAILRALEQVGTAEALPTVRRLAEAGASGGRFARVSAWLRARVGARPSSTIAAAAADCMPALEQRAAHQRLRETLLRPASGPPKTPEEQLLRPSEELGPADRP